VDIGTTVDGKYHITRLVGAGAMGSVFEAEHTGTGRRVAVKVISSGDLTRDEQIVGRFQREARAAGAIDTQYITQVLDTGRDRESGLPYLVMEYLTGEDVQHLLKRLGPISPDLALRIAAQACLGLQKAHEAKVVHRDIKPANLFLARRDAGEIIVKLLDFGIAKVKMDQANEAEGNELTRTGSMLGSPLYMSPEQARGNKSIDHRADIWSLGVVLYQALAGRTPYQHITALGQLIIAICSEWPQSVQDFAPWVSPEVTAIVHRALRHNPEERFQSAAEMFAAIRQLLPYGWTIHEDMLVSMPQGAPAAQRLTISLPSIPPPPPTHMGSSPGFGLGSQLQASPAFGVRAITDSGSSTTGPLVHSQAKSSASSKLPLVLGGVFLLAAGGVGAYFVTRSPPPVPVPVPAQTAVALVTTAAQPVLSAQPSAVPAVIPVAETKVVKVVIKPPDSSIEVNGAPSKADRQGILEITGPLGSVQKIRLFKGKNEITFDVAITEQGATPPLVELPPPGAPRPAPGASATPVAPKTAPTPPTQPGIIPTFE
jgi:serine/threonine-protein kinase